MGIPGESIEKTWRNDINDVAQLLNTRYGNRYQVFNLTFDTYDYKKFNNQVHAFPDHHPPSMQKYWECVTDLHRWLNGTDRVAAVHCLAGRSRTGTIVCGYLLYSKKCATADEAINLFNFARSKEGQNVILPSQVRYVHYFEQLLKMNADIIYNPPTLYLRSISVDPVIPIEGGKSLIGKSYTGGAVTPFLIIEDVNKSTEKQKVRFKQLKYRQFWREDKTMDMKTETPLKGDVQLILQHKARSMKDFTVAIKRLNYPALTTTQMASLSNYPFVVLFRYTFNTMFIGNYSEHPSFTFSVGIDQLDPALAGTIPESEYISSQIKLTLKFEAQCSNPLLSGLPLGYEPEPIDIPIVSCKSSPGKDRRPKVDGNDRVSRSSEEETRNGRSRARSLPSTQRPDVMLAMEFPVHALQAIESQSELECQKQLSQLELQLEEQRRQQQKQQQQQKLDIQKQRQQCKTQLNSLGFPLDSTESQHIHQIQPPPKTGSSREPLASRASREFQPGLEFAHYPVSPPSQKRRSVPTETRSPTLLNVPSGYTSASIVLPQRNNITRSVSKDKQFNHDSSHKRQPQSQQPAIIELETASHQHLPPPLPSNPTQAFPGPSYPPGYPPPGTSSPTLPSGSTSYSPYSAPSGSYHSTLNYAYGSSTSGYHSYSAALGSIPPGYPPNYPSSQRPSPATPIPISSVPYPQLPSQQPQVTPIRNAYSSSSRPVSDSAKYKKEQPSHCVVPPPRSSAPNTNEALQSQPSISFAPRMPSAYPPFGLAPAPTPSFSQTPSANPALQFPMPQPLPVVPGSYHNVQIPARSSSLAGSSTPYSRPPGGY